mmetsp:Transcript_46586/g.141114  ORF Transcript_46586/g.141114 Transcript_46586/m.141114 type:complete len:322 (-) Transcript_46586:171-1136(-)
MDAWTQFKKSESWESSRAKKISSLRPLAELLVTFGTRNNPPAEIVPPQLDRVVNTPFDIGGVCRPRRSSHLERVKSTPESPRLIVSSRVSYVSETPPPIERHTPRVVVQCRARTHVLTFRGGDAGVVVRLEEEGTGAALTLPPQRDAVPLWGAWAIRSALLELAPSPQLDLKIMSHGLRLLHWRKQILVRLASMERRRRFRPQSPPAVVGVHHIRELGLACTSNVSTPLVLDDEPPLEARRDRTEPPVAPGGPVGTAGEGGGAVGREARADVRGCGGSGGRCCWGGGSSRTGGCGVCCCASGSGGGGRGRFAGGRGRRVAR